MLACQEANFLHCYSSLVINGCQMLMLSKLHQQQLRLDDQVVTGSATSQDPAHVSSLVISRNMDMISHLRARLFVWCRQTLTHRSGQPFHVECMH